MGARTADVKGGGEAGWDELLLPDIGWVLRVRRSAVGCMGVGRSDMYRCSSYDTPSSSAGTWYREAATAGKDESGCDEPGPSGMPEGDE